MKRIALFIIAMFTLGFTTQAQSTFARGTATVSIRLGTRSTLSDKGLNVLLPPLFIGIDHSVASGLFDGNDSVDIGGYLGAEVYRYKDFDGSVWSQTLVGPHGSLHYRFVDRLDTYFSLMLGVNIISWDYNMKMADNAIKDKDTAASFSWSAHIGAHCYLSDHWAAVDELDRGLTFLTLGTTYRF